MKTSMLESIVELNVTIVDTKNADQRLSSLE